ncbi:MAG: autotransporter outer membrane beta-barrel domain-containing protein [Sutterella sp.]|nr:autotransporter outer membrane beta-barrel domain-containing protein [Sutterella sp.]
MTVNNGSLTVNGDTIIEVNAMMKEDQTNPGENEGIYVLYAGGNQAKADLSSNVDIVLKQDDPNIPFENVGLNVLYTRYGGEISIGNESSETRMWTISSQPDLISAKDGGSVIIHSKRNQLVGSIDFLGAQSPEHGDSIVSITFEGSDSYWFGDEQSWQNADISKNNQFISYEELPQNNDQLNLTFKDGAQWIYFGFDADRTTGSYFANTIVKRISSITLQNGGVINLFDAHVDWLLDQTGLTDLISGQTEHYNVEHNYVRIGDLKGSGGIFRLDLDAENIANSDMIFIEGSSNPGMHYIEPYNLEKLTDITPDNTLRFATVKTDSGVTFADKQNFYGESLYDYELEIASETYDPADPNNTQYEDRVVEDGENALVFDNTYTNWVITRIIRSSSAASLAMTGIGYAAYDTITQMDSYHDRVDAQSRADNGLWVRYRYGHGGIDSQYRRDYDTLTIGAQLLHNNSQSAGIAVSLNNSDVDLVDVTGTGESDGYEIMLYNTWLLGSHYIDVVGRIGQLDTEFNAVNQIGTLSTSGDFEQNYFALSGEYGYRYTDEHNVFLEPQLQLQYTHIKSESYRTNRDLWADIDSANVLTARAGVRAGKEWSTAKTAGEVYLATNVFYQFTDGQDARYTDGTNTSDVTWGDRHAWLNVGLTANMQIQDRINLQVQLSKDFAGDVKNTWYAQARLGYLF